MRTLPKALLSLTLLASLSTACRPAAEASADFEEASNLWLATVVDAEEPGRDPRAAQALTLARKVPANSIDADAAKSLIQRIEETRRNEAEAAAELQAQLEEAAKQPRAVQGERDPQEEGDEGEEDATPESLQVGMSQADFKTLFGACVRVDSEFVEARGSRKGQAFVLVDSAKCKEAHPELGTDLVYVLDGKVYNVGPRSAGIPVVQTAEGWKPESGDWPAPPPKVAQEDEDAAQDEVAQE